MSDLVGNPEDRFSRVTAHLLIPQKKQSLDLTVDMVLEKKNIGNDKEFSNFLKIDLTMTLCLALWKKEKNCVNDVTIKM